MRHQIVQICLCAILSTVTGLQGDEIDTGNVTPQPVAPNKTEPKPTQAMVEQWIADLDSDQYDTREDAMKSLVGAGVMAVKPLTAAALGENLEVSSRAVRVLFELYREGDSAAADAAEIAMEKLLDGPPSVARRSAQAMSVLGEVRQHRAVRAIEKLGGMVRWMTDNQPADFNIQRENLEGRISYILLGKSWKGGDDGLLHVERLGERLQTLYVTSGATVSYEALEKLERALPDLTVQRRGQACLGVSCNLSIPVCQIQFVQEGSAAEKAGLQAGDVITKFGDEVVEDFQSLVEMIKQRDAGDKLDVTINRRGTVMVREVELAEWQK